MSTSIFDFLFRTKERNEARSALASASAQHELATVITQATVESLYREVKKNESVRRQLCSEIKKAKEHDSGERAAVASTCGNCFFCTKDKDGVCHCDLVKSAANVVAAGFTCEFWKAAR